MQYGTKGSSGPFRLTISIRDEPRCPVCAEYLQPCVIEFRDGWAICAPCASRGLHRQQHIAFILASDGLSRCSLIRNGLRFYTPDSLGAKTLTAYEWYENAVAKRDLDPTVASDLPDIPTVADQPDGAYALTPDGEHLLADLDTRPLRETERILKRHNNRP